LVDKYYKARNNPPLPSALYDLILYDPATGGFTWKVTRCSRALAGNKAGHIQQGKLILNIAGSKRLGSDVAWCYMTGEWPDGFRVVSKNGDNLDISWGNLDKVALLEPKVEVVTKIKGRVRKSLDSIPVGSWERENL